MSGTRVTAQPVKPDSQQSGVVVIEDNYVLVVDGTAYRHGVVVHYCKDGTQTHVITVKGIKR